MDWAQLITSIISIPITIAALFAIWRNASNRLILDGATERLLHRLEQRVVEQENTIGRLERHEERDHQEVARLKGMLDHRDIVVKTLTAEVAELKVQMDKVAHNYKAQIDHWQQRAIDAEAELTRIKAGEQKRRL